MPVVGRKKYDRESCSGASEEIGGGAMYEAMLGGRQPETRLEPASRQNLGEGVNVGSPARRQAPTGPRVASTAAGAFQLFRIYRPVRALK